MERSEPTLVPEWLKSVGSSTSGSSTSHSDDHPASRAARNKSFVNGNGNDFGRSLSSERTTSSYFRRSSSSNSYGNFRSYNGFGRNQRARDREDTYNCLDQENSSLAVRGGQKFSDLLADTSLSKFERDGLRRSQSVISGKRREAWPKKAAADLGSASVKISNGLLAKVSPVAAGVSKATFDRDFPSLGVDERAGNSEIGRVPSPGLSTAIQSLPIATSASLGGEKWTSALAEVPILVGSNGSASLSVLQENSSSSASAVLGSTTSLNMAEAVAQGPTRTQTTPQLSVGTQRLEELAIKQSRQLIPVTPSMPKTLVLNSSDKQKTKVVSQQHHSISPSLPVNHSPRGGPVKGDVSKASNVGKLHVLKPVREKNGVNPVVKDNLSPTSGRSVAASPPVSIPAALKGPLNNPVPDNKPVLNFLEKRPISQARSRNDFFNLVRKKSSNPASVNSAATSALSVSESGSAISPSFSDEHAAMDVMASTSQPLERPLSLCLNMDCLSEEKTGTTWKGDANDEQKFVINGKKHSNSEPIIPEEEEAAFLRSLGWEENDDEEGLTEEEISAFYRDLTKYINSKPSPRILQLVQQKLSTSFDLQLGHIDEIPSGLSSSVYKLEP